MHLDPMRDDTVTIHNCLQSLLSGYDCGQQGCLTASRSQVRPSEWSCGHVWLRGLSPATLAISHVCQLSVGASANGCVFVALRRCTGNLSTLPLPTESWDRIQPPPATLRKCRSGDRKLKAGFFLFFFSIDLEVLNFLLYESYVNRTAGDFCSKKCF